MEEIEERDTLSNNPVENISITETLENFSDESMPGVLSHYEIEEGSVVENISITETLENFSDESMPGVLSHYEIEEGSVVENISITETLENFSDESIHRPGMLDGLSHYEREEGPGVKFFVTALYGNGNHEENIGYVSIVFNFQMPFFFNNQHDFNFSCVVAVKDAAGNKRFVRTLTFPYDARPKNTSDAPIPVYIIERYIEGDDPVAIYTIDRYIARDTLLDDRDILLPGDELTLLLDISLQTIPSSDKSTDILETAINSAFEIEEDSDGDIVVLSLNTDVAQRLHEESSVFRALCDNPMIESSAGLVHLYDDDINALKNASKIIMGAKNITFSTLEEISRLYVLADKYDIQRVIRACRIFFNKMLVVENVWEPLRLIDEKVEKILTIARFFRDDILKEIILRFTANMIDLIDENLKKQELGNVTYGNNITCVYTGKSPYLNFALEEEGDEDRSSFEFYN